MVHRVGHSAACAGGDRDADCAPRDRRRRGILPVAQAIVRRPAPVLFLSFISHSTFPSTHSHCFCFIPLRIAT